MILCVINGDELVFNRDLLSQGFQGGRLAAQEITKAIAEHLTKEEVQVYGRLSFWITLYFNKADLLEAVLSNGVCTHEHFEAFYAVRAFSPLKVCHEVTFFLGLQPVICAFLCCRRWLQQRLCRGKN